MANQFDGADGWFRIDCCNSLREERCTLVLFGTSILFDALADRCAKARLERLERNLSHVLAPQESQIGASVSPQAAEETTERLVGKLGLQLDRLVALTLVHVFPHVQICESLCEGRIGVEIGIGSRSRRALACAQ